MSQDQEITITKGRILLYRVFDVGNEIDLEKATLRLQQGQNPNRLKLKKDSRAIIINNAPLIISVGPWSYQINGIPYSIEIIGKIWYFGSVSIQFQIQIPSGSTLLDLVSLGFSIENDQAFTDYAFLRVSEITNQISDCIDKKEIWNTYEDYISYNIESLSGIKDSVLEILQCPPLYSLLLSDPYETPSNQLIQGMASNYFQYGKNDLALIEWNSALLIDPGGSADVSDVIEFSLCQLLEMRYYDDLLDTKLNYLYSAIITKKGSILSDYYAKISEEAAIKYLEVSEVVENIENSLKVIGDFYLARIYRAASNRFRIADWHASVDNKLNNLAEVSKILQAEISEKRSTLLEFIIIILIAVEVVPLIFKLWI